MLPNHAPLVGGRAVRHARGAAPGPDRPRHRSRARHRSGHGPRPAPRPTLAVHRGRVPGAAGRAARLLRGHFPEGHPYRHITAVPGAGLPPGPVAARLERLQRARGRRARACRSPSPTTSRPATPTRPSPRTAAQLPAVRGPRPSPTSCSASTVVCADDRRAGRAGWPGSGAAGLRAAAQRTARAGSRHPRRRPRTSTRALEREIARSWTASHVVGGPDTVRERLLDAGRAHRRRRADDHDHGPRPRRARSAPTSWSPRSWSSPPPERPRRCPNVAGVSELEAADQAVTAALDAGARYADARVMHRRHESMSARNGDVESVDQHADSGIGVRALVGSGWGFFAIADLGRPRACAPRARAPPRSPPRAPLVARADVGAACPASRSPDRGRASARSTRSRCRSPTRATCWCGRRRRCASTAPTSPRASTSCGRRAKWFVSSEGHRIDQHIRESGAGIMATAIGDGETQRRSYPAARGQYGTQGWELVEELDLEAHAARVGVGGHASCSPRRRARAARRR